MSANPISTTTEFESTVLKSPKAVLVDFYADWCGPCKIMAPVIEQIAVENPDIVVAKVDVDASSELAAMYNVSSIPTFLVFAGGKVVGQTIGAVPKAKLMNLIAEAKSKITQ